MEKKTTKIILIVSSVLALGGIAYYIYSKQQQKKMAEIYRKSVEEMATKYQIFNNPSNK
jgi:uncharacterized membrane protein YebE (DUF533 family)